MNTQLTASGFTHLRQTRVARVAISASTARGRPSGTVPAAREFLAAINLQSFAQLQERAFARRLDRLTATLCAVLPDQSASWGFARKFLNIFLRDSLYDAHLSRTFRLARIERWLEVPLDGDVGRSLLAEPEGASLPRWTAIYKLDPATHLAYQQVASRVAARKGIARVHLDLLYWSGIDV
jgi:hypothetical protein